MTNKMLYYNNNAWMQHDIDCANFVISPTWQVSYVHVDG